MPEIAAFRAVRYRPDRFGGDWSALIAPPYDVLSAADKACLLRRCDRNIVAIDLPHVPPESAGPDEVYRAADGLLRRWLADGTLQQDDRPAIYVYHQEYAHAGRTYLRRKFFARMRLEPFGAGTVFPHEQTFGGPKEDRLKLMQATRCQLSAVFGLYSDPVGEVSGLLGVAGHAPDVTAVADGVVNRLWALTAPAVIEAVARAMRDRPVYIADGHHRYGTALMYRDMLAGQRGSLPPDDPAQFVLVGFCAMEDPGAIILPTHRVISDFGDVPPARVLEALRHGVALEPLPVSPEDADRILPPDSPHDLAVYVAAGNALYGGRFTQRGMMDRLAAEMSPAWRQLDVAYIHRVLIDHFVRQALDGRACRTQYCKVTADTIPLARSTGGVALFCKACTVGQLKAVSDAGDLMPQKSTFFYPKLATGLVVCPLEA